MNPVVVSLLGAALVPTAPALKPEPSKTLESFQGKWTVTELSTNSSRVPAEVLAEMTLTVRGERFDLEPGLLASGRGDGSTTYRFARGHTYWAKLDPTASPPRIDLLLVGSDRPPVFPGIYQLDGDRLIITYAITGDRPTKFSTGGRPEVVVLEFRRTKK